MQKELPKSLKDKVSLQTTSLQRGLHGGQPMAKKMSSDDNPAQFVNQQGRKGAGTSAFNATVAPNQMGMRVPRMLGGISRGTHGMVDAATATHRAPISESQLPRQRVTVNRIVTSEDPNAGNTQANGKIVPSAMGNRDNFWGQVKSYGRSGPS
jgi:hypothetical protein